MGTNHEPTPKGTNVMITIYRSFKGGVGTTTLAAAHIVHASRTGATVVGIDLTGTGSLIGALGTRTSSRNGIGWTIVEDLAGVAECDWDEDTHYIVDAGLAPIPEAFDDSIVGHHLQIVTVTTTSYLAVRMLASQPAVISRYDDKVIVVRLPEAALRPCDVLSAIGARNGDMIEIPYLNSINRIVDAGQLDLRLPAELINAFNQL